MVAIIGTWKMSGEGVGTPSSCSRRRMRPGGHRLRVTRVEDDPSYVSVG
jgi:hypothetical protein